jgi:hypothetical protein
MWTWIVLGLYFFMVFFIALLMGKDWWIILIISFVMLGISEGSVYVHRKYKQYPNSRFWKFLETIRCYLALENDNDPRKG